MPNICIRFDFFLSSFTNIKMLALPSLSIRSTTLSHCNFLMPSHWSFAEYALKTHEKKRRMEKKIPRVQVFQLVGRIFRALFGDLNYSMSFFFCVFSFFPFFLLLLFVCFLRSAYMKVFHYCSLRVRRIKRNLGQFWLKGYVISCWFRNQNRVISKNKYKSQYYVLNVP